MGVNVPNYGPGTEPGVLRRWAQTVEGLGFDLLMISDHIAVIPDRHPLLVARMAANLNDLSGGRLVLGVGAGWAAQEFGALGVPFAQRGKLTDDYLRAVRAAWEDDQDYRGGRIPIWVGGNSDAGLRRAVRLGEAWHLLRFTMPWLRGAVDRMTALAAGQSRPVPRLAPRIALRLTGSPITGPGRLAGEGTIDQVLGDLAQLRLLGADTVVLDPSTGDPGETHHPETAWQALATVSAGTRHHGEQP
jgi:alkanesulfonate monooxygenase SsuD/methylene tetrahydromethanopterin reductase-like flavin-dependent oxidoreductase (luciferase family)